MIEGWMDVLRTLMMITGIRRIKITDQKFNPTATKTCANILLQRSQQCCNKEIILILNPS